MGRRSSAVSSSGKLSNTPSPPYFSVFFPRAAQPLSPLFIAPDPAHCQSRLLRMLLPIGSPHDDVLLGSILSQGYSCKTVLWEGRRTPFYTQCECKAGSPHGCVSRPHQAATNKPEKAIPALANEPAARFRNGARPADGERGFSSPACPTCRKSTEKSRRPAPFDLPAPPVRAAHRRVDSMSSRLMMSC